MKKRLILLAVLFAAAAALPLLRMLYNRLSADFGSIIETPSAVQMTVSAGDTVPVDESEREISVSLFAKEFTVLNASGESVSNTDLIGRPAVLNFWASWCAPCRSELGAFDRLSAQYADRIGFLMINLTDGYRETEEIVRQFVSDYGYGFPVYFDTQGSAADAYGVYSIPLTVFLNADGSLRGTHLGAMSKETLKAYLDALLTE